MYDFVLIERVGTDKNNRYNPKQPIYNLIDQGFKCTRFLVSMEYFYTIRLLRYYL